MYSVLKMNYYPRKHLIKNLGTFFSNVRHAFQMVRKGYDELAVSEIDAWFNSVVPDMLREFRKEIDTYPGYFYDEYYEEHRDEIGIPIEELRSASSSSPRIDEWNERIHDACFERWKGIIDEMIFYFTEADQFTCSKKYPFENEEISNKISEAFDKARREEKETGVFHWEYIGAIYDKKLMKECEELEEYRRECRKKAFALFVEWFDCLWL